MKLVVGGSFQGKTDYAKEMFGLRHGVWVDGANCSRKELFFCQGVTHFDEFIRRQMKEGKDVANLAGEIFERNPDICIIANELGYGIVPVDPFDRKFREEEGRILQKIAAEAEEVHRVICGLGTVIKHA